jgi:hypothetical protein
MAKQIKATDIFESEDIFRGIRQSAEQAIDTLGKFKTELKQTADELKKTIGGATVGDTKSINELITATQKANDVKEKTIKIDQEQERLRKLAIQSEREELKLKKDLENQAIREQKAKDKELKQAQQEQSIYAQTSKRLNDLRKAYKDLAIQNRENTAEGQKLIAEITELDTKLKKVDATVGQHQRNVGNYEGATKSLKLQLRELTQALQQMETSDPRFQEMTQQAAELKDRIDDTGATIRATAGNAIENLAGGFLEAGKLGVAAFQGVEASMQLMGIENENVLEGMRRLQALAGLSDSLKALGELDQKYVEIKASLTAAISKIGLFKTATQAQTTATVAQTTATEGAAVATGVLGKSMKALPIIAIVAALASLVYMVYDYVTSSNAAAEATKQREEAERKANEETKKAAEFVAQESTQFVGLVMQLKNTNEGSKERSKLINQINSQYGTTLKNLKDETAFQAQLNQAVADYIEYAKAKFKMQKYEEAITRNLTLQGEVNSRLRKELEELNRLEGIMNQQKFKRLSIDETLNMTAEQRIRKENELKTIAEGAKQDYEEQARVVGSLRNQIENANQRLNNYGLAQVELTNITQKYNVVAEETTEKEDKKEKYVRKTIEALERETEVRKNLFNPEEVKQMMLLDEERAVLASDIAVIEAEISLKRAQGSKDATAIKNAEKQLFDARKKQIEDQLSLNLAQTDNVNEQEKLRKEAALNIMNLEKETTDVVKTQTEKRNEWAKFATEMFVKQSDERIAQLDKEIAAAEKQQDTLRELAANGNINARESLAENQRIIDEANRKKEQQERRKQMIELVSGVYQTYNQKVAANAENPLMETIRDTVLLQQFANTLMGNMPTFFDGTENTGKHGEGVDGKGGFHAILHPNERVVPKSLNEKIGSLSNEQLAKVAQEYQNGKLITGTQPMSAIDLSLLVNEMKDLKDVIRNKPETNIELGEITSSVMEIVKTTKQGNTLKTNRFKIRK